MSAEENFHRTVQCIVNHKKQILIKIILQIISCEQISYPKIVLSEISAR